MAKIKKIKEYWIIKREFVFKKITEAQAKQSGTKVFSSEDEARNALGQSLRDSDSYA